MVTGSLEEPIQNISPSEIAVETRSRKIPQPATEITEPDNEELTSLLKEVIADKEAQKEKNMPLGFGLLKPERLPDTEGTEQKSSNPADILESENLAKQEQTSEANQTAPTSQISTETLSQELPDTDPRALGITANEGPNKEYEETVMSVQRSLTAVLDNGDKQLIRLKIPVLYQSRTLRLNPEQRAAAKSTLDKLKVKREELTKFNGDIEQLLRDWNKIVEESTPNSSLLPESPTLPQNQSNNSLNRDSHPALSAGKNISYEVPKK
jgi:hypothetical protein